MKRALTAAALSILLTGTGQAADLKIGFIYPSPAADVGWAKQLDLGREAVEAAYGDRVETTVVDNVPQGPDAARVMNQMVSDGAQMLLLGSFGYMNDGLKLAQQNPDVAMLHASGFKQSENFATFTARNYEGFYLAGLAAGKVTESNIIGIVAAFAVPEGGGGGQRDRVGGAEGQSRGDDQGRLAQHLVRPAERAGGGPCDDLARCRCDLFTASGHALGRQRRRGRRRAGRQHQLGHEQLRAGKRPSPQSPTIGRTILSEKLARGSTAASRGADFRGGLADGTVKVVAWGIKAIRRGQGRDPRGRGRDDRRRRAQPLPGQSPTRAGHIRVAEGEVLPDPEIFSMNWLVSGIDGNLPK